MDDLSHNKSFPVVVLEEDVVGLPANVVEDVSTDQEHAFIIFKVVTSGNISSDYEVFQCGTMDHSRVVKLWIVNMIF